MIKTAQKIKNSFMKCNVEQYSIYIAIEGGSFLWNSTSDTLPIANLKNSRFSTIEEVNYMEKQWRVKNMKALRKKYGKLYPMFDKNGIFQTFLIEVINSKQFVIYPVEWRGLADIAN